MLESPLEVPSDVTFQQAIALTQLLLEKMAAGASLVEVADAIAALVKTENGARGFFVTYLTSDNTSADNPEPEVVRALQSSPEIVGELLAKNLAMSAATALTHRRNGNEEMARSSERVRDRSATAIELVQMPSAYGYCQKLLESVTTGEGDYKAFLERWGYDAQQRQLMGQALERVMLSRPG